MGFWAFGIFAVGAFVLTGAVFVGDFVWVLSFLVGDFGTGVFVIALFSDISFSACTSFADVATSVADIATSSVIGIFSEAALSLIFSAEVISSTRLVTSAVGISMGSIFSTTWESWSSSTC